MVPYDVQLIGGIVLHQGTIAEMATGEGKTLVATLPLYLNALTGRGAHLVTVNNYLARRDSQWMGHVFKYLGLTVACLDDTEPSSPERRAAYLADITYGTNNEFGFDYLRDNMVFSLEQRVQREHAYAIIDEVDSILIDEARTPLIISGPVGNEGDDKYAQFNRQVAELVRKQTGVVNTLLAEAEKLLDDDEDRGRRPRSSCTRPSSACRRTSSCSSCSTSRAIKQLVQRIELDAIADRKLPTRQQRMRDLEDVALLRARREGPLGPPDRPGRGRRCRPTIPSSSWCPTSREAIHRIDQDPDLLARTTGSSSAARSRRSTRPRARSSTSSTSCCRPTSLYEKDVDYLVQDGQVLIVDEFTGRIMAGPPLGRRAAPGGRGQGGGAGQGRDPDPRHHHDPELLPDVRQAGRHDRHGRDRGDRVLQIYGLEVSVIPTNQPIRRDRPGRPDLQDPAGEVQRDHRRGRAAARARAADPDRHGDRGRLRDAVAPAQAARAQARGAEREVPPARGGDRGRGGAEGRDHDRHQHGRPRHRHQARQGRST